MGVAAVVTVALVVGFGHAGQHMARSMLVPGAGLYDERPLVGFGLTALAVVATVGWLKWGVDWAIAAVVVLSVVLSGVLGESSHASTAMLPQPAMHEFPLVILVISAVGWLRSILRRIPFVARIRLRPRRELGGLADLAALPPVDRCRAAAVAACASPWPDGVASNITSAIEAPDIEARARRIGLIARGRRRGDPLRVDHAHARAALAHWKRLDADQLDRLRIDAERAWAGVPSSEPGWVRLLDGTLVAMALSEIAPSAVERWVCTLNGPMRLHRGHRPAWAWTPLGVAAGRADDWEHAAAAALARDAGWVGDDDWTALRQSALGAAARGAANRADERLIAAARMWTALVDDEAAARLLARPTVRRDPLAVALDARATRIIGERHSRCN